MTSSVREHQLWRLVDRESIVICSSKTNMSPRAGAKPPLAVLACAGVLFVAPGCGRVGYDLLRGGEGESHGRDGGASGSGASGKGGSRGGSSPGGAAGAAGTPSGGRCSGLTCDGGSSPPPDASGSDGSTATGGSSGTGGSGGTAATGGASGAGGATTDAGPDASSAGCVLAGVRYATGQPAALTGTLAITAAQSAKCIGMSACTSDRGVQAIQAACNFVPCQLWEPIDLNAGWYALRNAASGHCLDVDDNYTPSTELVQWDCWLPSSQNFQAVCAGGDEWRLVTRPSGDAIGITAASLADGAVVSHSADLGAPSQRFRIESRSGVFSPIAPTGESAPGAPWRYTTANPPTGWNGSAFNDSTWTSAPGGFGSGTGSSLVVRTQWTTANIWMRKSFTLTAPIPSSLTLRLSHDEDVEVYLNGVLAFSAPQWVSGYFQAPVSAAALAALVSGQNELAVHCTNTTPPQFIDVGLGEYAWTQ